jgi:hypothetical protein
MDVQFRSNNATDAIKASQTQDSTQFNRRMTGDDEAGSLVKRNSEKPFNNVKKVLKAFFYPDIPEANSGRKLSNDDIENLVAIRRFYL